MPESKKVLIGPMERLRARFGLGPADLYVFETLRRRPGRPLSVNEIAEATGLKRPTVYFAQVRLFKRGLIGPPRGAAAAAQEMSFLLPDLGAGAGRDHAGPPPFVIGVDTRLYKVDFMRYTAFDGGEKSLPPAQLRGKM